MTHPAAVDPIIQRDAADCGIATLAMLTGLPYREVAETGRRLYPTALQSGLYNTQMATLAAALGYRLRKAKLEDDSTGVVVFKRGKRWAHIAALFQGVVLNPADGLVWDLDAYLSAKTAIGPGRARVHSFFTLEAM